MMTTPANDQVLICLLTLLHQQADGGITTPSMNASLLIQLILLLRQPESNAAQFSNEHLFKILLFVLLLRAAGGTRSVAPTHEATLPSALQVGTTNTAPQTSETLNAFLNQLASIQNRTSTPDSVGVI